MKSLWLVLITCSFAGEASAASLTCINPKTSPPTQWSVGADGIVNRGSISITQPITVVPAMVSETEEEKKIEFNKFLASPFHGGCHIDFENVLSRKADVIFECGLHGYGRATFSPSAMYCHNNDRSTVRITFNDETSAVRWEINYLFGTCREYGKVFRLEGEAIVEATFEKDQCRFIP